MLFEQQKKFFGIQDGEVLYFNGTFVVDQTNRVIGLITAIKESHTGIRTYVTYHRPNQMPEIKKQVVLDPIEFEKFLNTLALSVGTKIPGAKLIEFSYRTRLLDDPFSHHLEELELEAMHQAYMLNMIKGVSRSDAYEYINKKVRGIVAQRV